MLIGISGKLGHGKDEIGKIIQYLSYCKNRDFSISYENWKIHHINNDWQIKKFASKIKEITALLTGCTVEQLENRDFKEAPLGIEWNHKERFTAGGRIVDLDEDGEYPHIPFTSYTPRKIMQLLGTEAGREIIHPNIWVNALFANYKRPLHATIPKEIYREYPNWIITDVRFPNEAKAILNKGGILIRINREIEPNTVECPFNTIYERQQDGTYKRVKGSPESGYPLVLSSWKTIKDMFNYDKAVRLEHPSETGLDDWEFEHVVDNSGTIEELIEKVKVILEKENIL